MLPKGKEPDSPISSRYSTSTNLSPPFTYSTTRPPTSFSEIGFSTTKSPKSPRSRSRLSSGYWQSTSGSKSPFPPPQTPLPPLPDKPPTPSTRDQAQEEEQRIDRNRFKNGDTKDDGDQEQSADLYHRSDWLSTGGYDKEDFKSATSSKWTRSSYKPSSRPFRSNSNSDTKAVPTIPGSPTSKPSTPYTNTSGYSVKTPKTTGKVQFADEQGQMIDSPNEIRPGLKKLGIGKESVPNTGTAVNVEASGNGVRQSTLPSIISLSHLTKNTVKKDDQKLGIVNPTPTYGTIGNSTNTTPATSPSTQLLSSESKHDDSLTSIPTLDNAGDAQFEAGSREIERDQGIYQRKPYQKSRTPDIQKQQTRLLDIKDQNKLGRMSVAPPRYTLPPPQRKSRRVTRIEGPKSKDGRIKNQHGNSGSITNILNTLRYSRLSRLYRTYKPFISPILSLTCALMLTVTHGTTSTSSIGEFLWVDKDAFDISRAGSTDVILGAWGWCQSGLNGPEPQCQSYDYRDFANNELSFTIPGDPSLDNLSSLLTALTVLTWLLSTYQIITAFLHFYLFFALSVPFNHLIECTAPTPPPAKTSKSKSKSTKREIYGKDPFIAEVDLRVKCERFPYESYYWVWWAWWGHRRSPLQGVFGNLVGVLGISTFAMTYKFKSSIIHATGSNDVAFGNGAYMSLMTILFTLDTFISSFIYFWNFKKIFDTFLNPPSPSPRVLLLPESENNLTFKHYQRRTGLQSFFAPISASATISPSAAHREQSRRFDTYLENPFTTPYTNVKTLGGIQQDDVSGLDEETLRWLSAYPHDNELVDLISDLRHGRHHSDFLLSEVGLLYLRPLSMMDEGMALLIPPRGVIRNELLQDAHLDYYPGLSRDLPAGSSRGGTGEGEGEIEEAHNNLDTMIKILNQNFWWNGMELDCKEFIENCQICFENLQRDTGVLNRQFPLNKMKLSS